MVSASNFSLNHVATSGQLYGSQQGGDAGVSQGSFDDQSIFTDIRASITGDALDERSSLNQFWLDGNSAFSSNSHTIQSKPNANLVTQGSSLISCVVRKNAAGESDVVGDGAFIDNSAVGITNLEVGLNPSTPRSEGAVTDSDIFDTQKLSLEFLKLNPILAGQLERPVGSNAFFNATTSLP